MRHAAFWNGRTPEGWPEVVDLIHHGIATSDYSIPFGTRLCIEITDVPSWAHEEYFHLIGRRAVGIVIDRTAPWVYKELGPALDLWPALFQQLAGPSLDWKRLGTFTVRYWVCKDEKYRSPLAKIVSQRRHAVWERNAKR